MARALFAINLYSIIGTDSALSVAAKLYFYEEDGVTLATTYTTSAGVTQNANPMLTQADGRFAEQAWLEPGNYVFVLTAPGGTPADPLVTGQFVAPTGPGEIDPALEAFLAGDEPLPLANGGTSATNYADALVELGALPVAGGTMTGNIVQSGEGVYHFWATAAMNSARWYLTVDSDPDPTDAAGEVWLKYT